MTGPLQGFRIIELAGIGPGPFAGMMLADMGAEVLRVDRAQAVRDDGPVPVHDVLGRGRRSIGVDLKHAEGRDAVLRLVEQADALIEGFRPGVMERLGLGPDVCLARNPRLVYGRMTGWGQEGPYCAMAGHDINYIALSGTLAMIGRSGRAAAAARSTCSATSAAAACCWPSEWSAVCSRRAGPGRARSSTPPWSTVPPCWRP